ncbi:MULTISPECIES: MarR family transcriptional regulator [Bacteria]|uniref:MarR family transcriptional regulator n=1 Tax=Bacteria TaxID=2 RepID=UPI0018CF6960|nr:MULTISPECIES: MarR family transcriptional regulator [Bacteria]MBG9523422.1 replication protein [Bacillus thuringiensis]MDX7993374.1 MarR family transcriptional regulator [Xenorhabdus sp. psl]HDR3897068.1 MarR family transcriptional regulator [Bacillus cereus]
MTNPDGFRQILNQAEDNARKRDVKKQEKIHNKHYTSLQEEQLGQALETLQDLTGNEYYIGRKRDKFAKVEFSQVIHVTLLYLVKIKYLTTSEKALLLDLMLFLEVGTNVLIEKNILDNQIDPDAINSASVQYLANELGRQREALSKMMTILKRKGILACAESGFRDETGRICTKRTWLMNPNIICCGKKERIDKVTKHIFKDILRNFKVEGSSEIHNLPIYFF